MWPNRRPWLPSRIRRPRGPRPDASPPNAGRGCSRALIGALGVAVLVAVLTGLVGQTAAPRRTPRRPPCPSRRRPPRRARAAAASVLAGEARHRVGIAAPARRRATRTAIVAAPSRLQQSVDARRFVDQTQTHISYRWMEGFYPIYAVAQRTFGVNWLLIASIHMQESAFSTAPGIYHGLNFAGCCGGPMQFNVTNGPRYHVAARQQLLHLRQAPRLLQPHDRHPPVDLRRLRLDHGRRPPAVRGRG